MKKEQSAEAYYSAEALTPAQAKQILSAALSLLNEIELEELNSSLLSYCLEKAEQEELADVEILRVWACLCGFCYQSRHVLNT